MSTHKSILHRYPVQWVITLATGAAVIISSQECEVMGEESQAEFKRSFEFPQQQTRLVTRQNGVHTEQASDHNLRRPRSQRAAPEKHDSVCFLLPRATLSLPGMASDGIFQQYFTSYRRTPPLRFATAAFGRFGVLGRQKTLSRTSSISKTSVDETVPPHVMAAVEGPLAPLTTTNGTLPHDPPVEPSATYDPSIFRSYLLALLPPVIGASPAELESLFDDDFDERVSRFASDSGGVIYVVKVRDEAEGAWCAFLRYI